MGFKKVTVFYAILIFVVLASIDALAKRRLTVSELARLNKPAAGLVLLDQIEKRPVAQGALPPDTDLTKMTRARLYFQMGELNKSEEVYNQIPKSSDYWLEALEEKSHINGRRGEYAKALEQLQTVMSAPFETVVGPEPYFVAALTSLKICDYTSIFKINNDFKKRFAPRLERLKDLTTGVTLSDAQVQKLISQLRVKMPMNYETVGALAAQLPRYTSRDGKLRELSVKPRTQYRDRFIAERIHVLAQQELKEIKETVSKLHIIEAEAIQNIYLAENENAERELQGSADGEWNQLKFPKTDEIWLDELTHYAVQVEKCPNTPLSKDRQNKTKRASL